MAQSLKRRLEAEGKVGEVLKISKYFGLSAGMEAANVKDYISFKKFLSDETGNENFGLHPVTTRPHLENGQDAFDWVIEKALHLVAQVQAQNLQMDKRIKLLETQNQAYTENQQAKLESGILRLLDGLQKQYVEA